MLAATQPSATAHPRNESLATTRTTPLASSALSIPPAAPTPACALARLANPAGSALEAPMPEAVAPEKDRQFMAIEMDVAPPSYSRRSWSERMLSSAGRTSDRVR